MMLGAGEAEAIALAAQRKCRVILDDHRARSVATRIGVEMIGTVGILLQAKRAGLVSEVGPLLDSLNQVGFRVDTRLRQKALELANERPEGG
jgi:predicted nucleic acid-binding protein